MARPGRTKKSRDSGRVSHEPASLHQIQHDDDFNFDPMTNIIGNLFGLVAMAAAESKYRLI